MSSNRHGLTRNIPEAVKRSVRQRCGFGCVNCAASIYEYDHFDPDFANAHSHDSAGITLLCPTCHGLKTKGILTVDKLTELNNAPAARSAGHSRVDLPYFEGVPAVRLGGGLLITNTFIPFQIYDEPAILLRRPEIGSKVTRISATIRGPDGQSVLKIIDNEWLVQNGVWDFEWVGQRMTVKDATKTIVFQLTMFPPNFISVDYLITRFAHHSIHVTQTTVRADNCTIVDCQFDRWAVGIQLGLRSPWLEASQGPVALYVADFASAQRRQDSLAKQLAAFGANPAVAYRQSSARGRR